MRSPRVPRLNRIESIRYFNPLGALGWFVAGKIFRAGRIRTQHVWVHRLLFPLARALERLKGIPFGLSHIAIASKPLGVASPGPSPSRGGEALDQSPAY